MSSQNQAAQVVVDGTNRALEQQAQLGRGLLAELRARPLHMEPVVVALEVLVVMLKVALADLAESVYQVQSTELQLTALAEAPHRIIN
jgi:hypothetical protein